VPQLPPLQQEVEEVLHLVYPEDHDLVEVDSVEDDSVEVDWVEIDWVEVGSVDPNDLNYWVELVENMHLLGLSDVVPP